MKKLILLLALFQITTSYATPLSPKELFSADQIQEITISPDGKYIAYSMPRKNTDLVSIMDLDAQELTFSFEMGDEKYVGNLMWANSERLLIQPAMKYGSYDQKFLDGTLQAIDPDGENNTKLFGYAKGFSMSSRHDDAYGPYYIQDTLDSDPEKILITTYKNAESTRHLKTLDIYTGRISTLELSSVRKARLVTNVDGKLIAQAGITEDNTDIITYLNKEGEWVDINNTQNYDLIDSYKQHYLLMIKHLGDNQSELITLDRYTGEYESLTSFENIEITNIIYDNNVSVIGYITYDGAPKTVFLNPESSEAKLQRTLERSFPNALVRVYSSGKNSSRSVVKISSDKEPGVYYLLNSTDNKLSKLSANYKDINRDRFSIMSPVTFEARDGLQVPSYVTLPNNFKGNVPTVIMVHGGPFGVRDYWGFNKEVQLLASHGYAVMQINYRGSGGYGEEFQKAGHRQWGKAMQDDLTDGTQWAIDSGIADKDSICIYGGSYGGYAALMGVVKEPDLYQCAIGYVGVYDLPLKFDEGDVRRREEGLAFIRETMGTNVEELAKYSPARHVDKIKADLFLIHGEKDYRVPIKHYEVLTEALDEIDYPYESLVKRGEGHGFASKENQIELYQELLDFLDSSIGSNAD